MAHASPIRHPLKPLVRSNREQDQTTPYPRSPSGDHEASRKDPRGSKCRLPSDNVDIPVHGHFRQLLVRRVYPQPRAGSRLGHTLRERCGDYGGE